MTNTDKPRKTKKMIDRATIEAGIKMLMATPPKVETEFTQKDTVEMAATAAAHLFAQGYDKADVREKLIETFGLDLSPAAVGSYLKGASVKTSVKSGRKGKGKGKPVTTQVAVAPAEDAEQTAEDILDASDHTLTADTRDTQPEIAEASTADETPATSVASDAAADDLDRTLDEMMKADDDAPVADLNGDPADAGTDDARTAAPVTSDAEGS